MVERLATALRRLDEDTEIVAHAFLADIVIERAGPERAVDLDIVFRELSRDLAGMSWPRHVLEEIVLLGLPHPRCHLPDASAHS